MPAELTPVSIEAIRAAAERLAGLAIRTPLVRLNVEDAPAEIYLKLENLQPIGSFKIRGAGNKLRGARPKDLAAGVYTASSGNIAQGVAPRARTSPSSPRSSASAARPGWCPSSAGGRPSASTAFPASRGSSSIPWRTRK